ncbi:gamma-glutamylcyclotransferase [Alphaproteobacteria bacterium KMM 3653]|uniref:Gamma-glutamylcyclotransferase n=1 Tax=Harenicola maris TaxID=2841044 RepID=A0AAP2CM65_9RHOB|nr:gamma-glutamylcyclotransferase [Harenicola maris]
MQDGFFFGYGSLVNMATHSHAPAFPARITGWRRAWRQVAGQAGATLSAKVDEGSAIDGLIAHVAAEAWPQLDAREINYERQLVTPSVVHEGPTDAGIQIYHVTLPDAEGTTAPILLSYLDVVVQGYFRVFGPEGVADFFATTDGWDTPILDDRAEPLYPRHQRLEKSERALVDSSLERLSAQVQKAH